MANDVVLVGLELNDEALDKRVIEKARAFIGPSAELMLVHVHMLRQTSVLDYTRVEPPERVAAEVEAATKKLEALCKEAGPCRVDVEVGHPPETMVRLAAGARLAVIGRAKSGLFDRLLKGSVESRLVHEASCPVLVVP